MNTRRKKYIFVFIITLGIFVTVFLLVNFFNTGKRQNIADLQQTITIDLIANETQFDLLKNAPCKAIEGGSVLSQQMNELGNKLAYAEETQGVDNDDVLELKKYYSLLEIKDYLLSQEVSKKCDVEIESMIYFYEQGCDDCVKQGFVLNELKRKYPWLRIYSFDKNLDFSIVETFVGLYDITEKSPVIIIDDETYFGFKTVEEIESYIPELILKKEKDERIVLGIEYILNQEEYLDRGENEIVFINESKGIYNYSLINDDIENEDLSIKLIFDTEKDSFSIIK